jgi:Mrp family chromosome partitioning ATPase
VKDHQSPLDDTELWEHLPPDMRCLGVLSGKGGVGKSLVTALLACAFARAGRSVGILDADLTGPSIPRMFGLRRPGPTEEGRDKLVPALTDELSIRVISLNLLMDKEDDPVIWRGPLVAKTVEQFITDVDWDGVDYLFIDLPPGTSDVPLTVMQRLPLHGLVVVTSPQELVGMIVRKAVKMAGLLDVPVLGLVENMTHLVCPNCGARISLFGGDSASDLPILARIPLDPSLSELCDHGRIESYAENPFRDLVDSLSQSLEENAARHA